MLDAAKGLTRVTTADLKKALAALHRGELSFPLNIGDLTRVGLQHRASDILAVARKLDAAGLRAVLVAVIAERLAAERRRPR